jgi:hypothetical protein
MSNEHDHLLAVGAPPQQRFKGSGTWLSALLFASDIYGADGDSGTMEAALDARNIQKVFVEA